MHHLKFGMLIACILLLGTSAFAQDDYRLDSPQNVLNSEYRHEFYKGKITDMEREFGDHSRSINHDKIVLQFGLIIDQILGADFSGYKKNTILNLQRDTLDRKQEFRDSYNAGISSYEEYIASMSVVAEENLEETSELLTNDEFIALFRFKKTEIKGFYYRLLNQSLLESEQIPDIRK
ncbi:hypothetical protein ACFL05_00020 [Patescibacteria group bacterium]